MTKKGSMELSVNSIVILVLAITMLGLGLSFIRGMFGKGTSRLGQIIDTTDLDTQPTASNPVTIQNPLEVSIGETKTLDVGFYNTNRWGSGTATASIKIKSCQDGDIEFTTSPKIYAPSQDVGPSQIGAYSAIFDITDAKLTTDEDGDISAGTYICILEVYNADTVYDTKQFFLKVVS